MSQLYLLRHAESVPGSMADDYDRPLSDLGRQEAERMARHMRETGVAPQLVLCSAAARARQTWKLVAPAMPPDLPCRVEPSLYMASAGRLLGRIREVPEATRGVLVIAHNPGLQQLASLLSVDGEPAGQERLSVVLPPCGLAVLSIGAASWAGLGAGDGRLSAVVTPRDLGVIGA